MEPYRIIVRVSDSDTSGTAGTELNCRNQIRYRNSDPDPTFDYLRILPLKKSKITKHWGVRIY